MRGAERLWSCCLVLACGAASEPSSQSAAAPPGGTLRLDPGVLASVERSQGVTPERARELATEDALLAFELARREPALAQSIERLVLARSLARTLLEEASLAGPPTDAEVAQLTQERWWELDRPRMVQVMHAVVLTEAESQAAQALAEGIAQAVAGAKTSAEFQKLAREVPADGHKLKLESLPPVSADGRAIEPERAPPLGPPETKLVADFAAAAHRLERVGQVSPVVRTPFGYHVLFATRFVEPRQPSLDERRELLRPQILQRRALAAQTELLDRERKQSAPEQSRSALRSMAKLAVAE